MRMGTHGAAVAAALQVADYAFIYQLPEWDDIDALAATVAQLAQAGDHVLVMSNGGFGGIHDKLLTLLAS